MPLDKEAFFIKACAPDIVKVEGLPDSVPDIWVRSMTVGQRAVIAKISSASDSDVVSLAACQTDIITWCVCDETGKLVFDETNRDRAEGLSAAVSDTISLASMAVSGMEAKKDTDGSPEDGEEGDTSDLGNQ